MQVEYLYLYLGHEYAQTLVYMMSIHSMTIVHNGWEEAISSISKPRQLHDNLHFSHSPSQVP